MKIDTINALFRYFEALYSLNQDLIVLCGIDVINNKELFEKHLENTIMAIPRLVPYRYDRRKGQCTLSGTDGLMSFSDDILYLRSEYSSLIKKHNAFLGQLKQIRNKLEHEMHGASVVASSSGTEPLFDVTYNVFGTNIRLTAKEMISFAVDLNVLFAKMQNDIENYPNDNSASYSTIMKLNRFIFTDFNKIYTSDLICTFGMALLPF